MKKPPPGVGRRSGRFLGYTVSGKPGAETCGKRNFKTMGAMFS
jgi:hypothetical protein